MIETLFENIHLLFTVSHQVAIQLFWLHFWAAIMLSIFMYSL